MDKEKSECYMKLFKDKIRPQIWKRLGARSVEEISAWMKENNSDQDKEMIGDMMLLVCKASGDTECLENARAILKKYDMMTSEIENLLQEINESR